MTTRGLAQGAAGGMRRARVQNARVAGGASDGFRGPSTAQAEADRVNILVSIRNSSQARTDSQARPLICSRVPKAEPGAVVPASGLRTTTVSRT